VVLFSCQSKSESKLKTSVPVNDAIEMPFADTLSNNWIVVKASVNHQPAFLLLDNGTSSTTELILFDHYAKSRSIIDTLKPIAVEMKRIEKMPTPVSINNFYDTLKTELLVFHNAPVEKQPDGILGKGFLTKYLVEIDYDKRMLKLHDTLNYRVPSGFKQVLLTPLGPFYKFNADIFINGERISESLCLDLGSSLDGLLFGFKFYNKYKDRLKIDAGKTTEVYTVFSKSKGARLMIDSLNIGGCEIKDIASTVEVESSVSYYSASIGNAVLRHFGRVFFDLRNNKMYLPAE
jgi:hypothetical protein